VTKTHTHVSPISSCGFHSLFDSVCLQGFTSPPHLTTPISQLDKARQDVQQSRARPLQCQWRTAKVGFPVLIPSPRPVVDPSNADISTISLKLLLARSGSFWTRLESSGTREGLSNSEPNTSRLRSNGDLTTTFFSEIAELMAVKSKHGAGGEYTPDWAPRVRCFCFFFGFQLGSNVGNGRTASGTRTASSTSTSCY